MRFTVWFAALVLILTSCGYSPTSNCQNGRLVTVSGPNLILLTPSGEQFKTMPYRGYGLSVSPSGKQIAFGSNDGLLIQDLENGESHIILDWPLQEYNPIWSPDERLLAFAYGFEDSKMVEVIDIASGTTSRALPDKPSNVEMEYASIGLEIISSLKGTHHFLGSAL